LMMSHSRGLFGGGFSPQNISMKSIIIEERSSLSFCPLRNSERAVRDFFLAGRS
jgi:hypothetical protein